MKPRLRPLGSTELVITRPWYLADTATRPPAGDSSTLIGPKRARNATSSSNVLKLGIAFSLSGPVAFGVELQATEANNAHDIQGERLHFGIRKGLRFERHRE